MATFFPEGADAIRFGPKRRSKRSSRKVEAATVRGNILKTKSRIDGRDLVTVRQIESEVGVLPRTHGSSLFTRGETQAIVVATLGTGDDEQMIDGLDGLSYDHFMLHYNFPPYSVGEVGRYRLHRAAAKPVTASSHGARCTRCCPRMNGISPIRIRILFRTSPSPMARPLWRPSAVARLSMMDAGVPI